MKLFSNLTMITPQDSNSFSPSPRPAQPLIQSPPANRTFLPVLGSMGLLAVLMFAPELSAQPVSLAGQVIDPQGAPMDGVLVRLLGADLGVLTGSDGKFVFEENTAQVLFPRRLTSISTITWAGPGQPVKATFQEKCNLSVLMFNAKGDQVAHRHQNTEAGEVSMDLGAISDEVVLVSIHSQAIDRLAYRIAGTGASRTATPIFSTCANATVAAVPEMDILSVEHPRFAPSRVVLKAYAKQEAALAQIKLAALPVKEIHVDPTKGTDGAAGTAQAPLKSLTEARTKLKGGETVILYDGNYGTFTQKADSGFTWWVTFVAAPNAKPVFEKLDLVNQEANFWDGEFDLRMRFEGLTIKDGVDVRGMRWVEVNNCLINRAGDLNGSDANMAKAGVAAQRSRSIRIEKCEITHAGNGVGVSGNHLILRRNHIHHVSQDGFNFTGGHDFLAEYNDIHDMEDGSGDKEGNKWNRHSDGMQIYPWFATNQASNWMADVTLRGNRIYRPESMCYMIQAKNPYQLKRFLIENNITAAAPGYMFHFKDSCDGVVLRFNSFIVPADGYQFKGMYGRDFTTKGSNNFVAVPGGGKGSLDIEVYGNLFGNQLDFDGANLTRCDNNLYYVAKGGTNRKKPLHASEAVVRKQPYLDLQKIDGVLAPDCPALKAGMKPASGSSERANVPLPAYDFSGKPRTHQQITLGAVEP